MLTFMNTYIQNSLRTRTDKMSTHAALADRLVTHKSRNMTFHAHVKTPAPPKGAQNDVRSLEAAAAAAVSVDGSQSNKRARRLPFSAKEEESKEQPSKSGVQEFVFPCVSFVCTPVPAPGVLVFQRHGMALDRMH